MDMVTIRNKGTARVIPAAEAAVETGGTVDVPADLAGSLLEQTDRWELVAADRGEEDA